MLHLFILHLDFAYIEKLITSIGFDKMKIFWCFNDMKILDFVEKNEDWFDYYFGYLMEIFWRFWLSSIESLIFKALRGFWEVILMILLNSKVIKMLIFQCFVELITELGNDNRRVDRRDIPFWQSNTCSKNVNIPGIHTEQTFLNIL